MSGELGFILHFVIGFVLWVLCLWLQIREDNLTELDWCYSPLIVLFGWLSLYGVIVYLFLAAYDHIGKKYFKYKE